MSTTFSLKMEPRRDHFCVIENHQGLRGKKIRQIAESFFINLTGPVVKKLRRISFRKRVFGNSLVIETVIIVFNVDFGYHFVQFNNLNKDTSFTPNTKTLSQTYSISLFCTQN